MRELEQSANLDNLAIHEYGIGRTALGPWFKDLVLDMGKALPESHSFIPRKTPGISYVSGHNIATMKNFAGYADAEPRSLIRGLVSAAQQKGFLRPLSQEVAILPFSRIAIDRKPKNNERKVSLKVHDIDESEYSDKLLIYGERTGIEKSLFNTVKSPKVLRESRVVLGSIAVQEGEPDFKAMESVIAEVVPKEIVLNSVGPISYQYGKLVVVEQQSSAA